MEKILEVLASIGFDWKVAFANFINFLIVFYLLNRFLFSKLRKVLAERKEKIEKGLEDARRAEEELLATEQKQKEVLDTARLKANHIVMSANSKSKDIVKQAKDIAEEEQNAVLEKTQIELDKKRKQMEKKVEERAIELAITATEKILREKTVGVKNEDFIEKVLNEEVRI